MSDKTCIKREGGLYILLILTSLLTVWSIEKCYFPVDAFSVRFLQFSGQKLLLCTPAYEKKKRKYLNDYIRRQYGDKIVIWTLKDSRQ